MRDPIQDLEEWTNNILSKGEKPPPGYTAIPGSKKGGYHKFHGGKWQSWYPHLGNTPNPAKEATAEGHPDHHGGLTLEGPPHRQGSRQTSARIRKTDGGYKTELRTGLHWHDEVVHKTLGEAYDHAHAHTHGDLDRHGLMLGGSGHHTARLTRDDDGKIKLERRTGLKWHPDETFSRLSDALRAAHSHTSGHVSSK